MLLVVQAKKQVVSLDSDDELLPAPKKKAAPAKTKPVRLSLSHLSLLLPS